MKVPATLRRPSTDHLIDQQYSCKSTTWSGDSNNYEFKIMQACTVSVVIVVVVVVVASLSSKLTHAALSALIPFSKSSLTSAIFRSSRSFPCPPFFFFFFFTGDLPSLVMSSQGAGA